MDRVLHSLRMTPSAASARRGERGVRGILASFPLQTQLSLRRLLSERFMIEAKLRAVHTRQERVSQPTDDTDDMRALKLALRDSNYNIKRLVGAEALPHVLALLGEPDVNDSMNLAAPTEEDARATFEDSSDAERAARGWRLTVGSAGHRVGIASQYRYTSHDSPNHKGQRSLVNKLNAATGEEGLSYYQTVQLRHGRTRSGSCGYAGVHSEVFGPGGVMRNAPEPQPIQKGASSPRNAGQQNFADNESTTSWGQPERSSSPRRHILEQTGQMNSERSGRGREGAPAKVSYGNSGGGGGYGGGAAAAPRYSPAEPARYSNEPQQPAQRYASEQAQAQTQRYSSHAHGGDDLDDVIGAAGAAIRALAAAQGLDRM